MSIIRNLNSNETIEECEKKREWKSIVFLSQLIVCITMTHKSDNSRYSIACTEWITFDRIAESVSFGWTEINYKTNNQSQKGKSDRNISEIESMESECIAEQ